MSEEMKEYIEIIRSIIQDTPRFQFETFLLDERTKMIQLTNFPVLNSEEYPLEISIDVDYRVDTDSGIVILKDDLSEIEDEYIDIEYYSAQLSDKEVEVAVKNSLSRYDVSSIEELDEDDFGFSQLLVASNCYYMLASKWATLRRVRTSSSEVHNEQVMSNFFDLGRRMEERFKEASAGNIKVDTITRRDVNTGKLVAIPEEVLDDETDSQ